MHIDDDGNMELSAEENQDLMDRLQVDPREYDDPPVDIECIGCADGVATFKATHRKTGKTVTLVFDAED